MSEDLKLAVRVLGIIFGTVAAFAFIAPTILALAIAWGDFIFSALKVKP